MSWSSYLGKLPEKLTTCPAGLEFQSETTGNMTSEVSFPYYQH